MKQIDSFMPVLISYLNLGNKSTHRWVTTQADPAVYIPGASTVADTNSRRILSIENAVQAAPIGSLTVADDGANANYNGLQISAKHRLNQNFSVLANYTWAHCFSEGDFNSELSGVEYQNPYNRNADRSNCQADQREVFNAGCLTVLGAMHRTH